MERANTMDGLMMALFGSKDVPPAEANPQIQATHGTHQYAAQGPPAGSDLPTAATATFPWMELQQQQQPTSAPSLQQAAPGPPMEQLDGLKFDEILELFNSDMDMPDFIGGALVAPEEWQQEPEQHAQQHGGGGGHHSEQDDAAAAVFGAPQQDQQQAQDFQQQYQLLESLTMDLDIFGDVNAGSAVHAPKDDAAMADASTSLFTAAADDGDSSLHHRLSTADTATSMERGFSSLLSAVGLEGLLPAQEGQQRQEQEQPDEPKQEAPPLPEAPGSPPEEQQPSDPAAEEPGERWGDATAPDEAERPGQQERPDYMKQMADALREKERKKAEDAQLSEELEERLGVKMPKSNVVTEFCNKHGRKALEETIERIESEASSSSASGFTDGTGVKVSKKSIFGRLSSALGIGKGKAAVAKPKGGGRIRPKDQLQALEQSLEALKKEQQDLLKEIEVKGSVVDKMDSVLSMKTEVMEEIKLSNVSLDSQLQEMVQRKLVDKLGSLALEERGKATSIPTIMLGGGASEESPAVDAMLQNWKYSIERLTQVLNDASAAGETTTKETVASVELQIQNILNFIINSLSSTAGASLIGLIKRGLLEAAAGNPNFIMEKYRRISTTIVFSNSQMKKLLALNKIFSSKIRELTAEKNTIVADLKTAVKLEQLPLAERARELQRGEQKVQDLRLALISMMEIRLLFNYTVFKKVMTPWQCGMCMMICYPMLPDPNFLSCAILNVNDLDDVPWSKFRELILAD